MKGRLGLFRRTLAFLVTFSMVLSLLGPARPASALITILNWDHNDAGASGPYIENSGGLTIDANVSINIDAGTQQILQAQVVITGGYNFNQDTLFATPSGNVTVNFDTNTGTLLLVGPDDDSIFESVLRTVTYFNSADNPSKTGGPDNDRCFRLTVVQANPVQSVTSDNVCFDITRSNDPPLLAPSSQVLTGGPFLIPVSSNTGPLLFDIVDPDDTEWRVDFVSSTNTALVDAANVSFSTTGFTPDVSRSITITPVVGVNGVATVVFEVTDDNQGLGAPGRLTTTWSLDIIVGPTVGNTPPTITLNPPASPNPVVLLQNVPMNIPLLVGDNETDANQLTVAVSAETLTGPIGAFTIAGAGANRFLQHAAFTALEVGTVTVTVTDNGAPPLTDTLVIGVNIPANAPPVISPIADQNIPVNGTTGPLAFTITDPDSTGWTTAVGSSNTTLVPLANISVVPAGPGPTTARNITVTPVAGLTGQAVITLTVSDNGTSPGPLSSSEQFVVNVGGGANTPPTISQIPNQTIPFNSTTGQLDFLIGDAETNPSQLVVTCVTSAGPLFTCPQIEAALGGSGANRTIQLNSGVTAGTETITLRVTDTGAPALSADMAFVLNVNASAGNTPPQISNIPNQVMLTGSVGPAIPFTIGDTETPLASLAIAVSGTFPGLPGTGLLAGAGANRTITLSAGAVGLYIVNVTVTDAGGLTATSTFLVNVVAALPGGTPTITCPADQFLAYNSNTGVLNVTVADSDTNVNLLTVTPTTSAPAVVPLANVIVNGVGANRTVQVISAAVSGFSIITLEVDDGTTSSTCAFVVNVSVNGGSGGNLPPTISQINNQTIPLQSSTGQLNFTIGDDTTPTESLTLTAASSNLGVIPAANIQLGGSNGTRHVQVMSGGAEGFATVTITVTDGDGATATSAFLVTVTRNTPPTIGPISDKSTPTNTVIVVPFTVDDAECGPTSVSIFEFFSSNTLLVPVANIVNVPGDNGTNRAIEITPATNEIGETIITIHARDNVGACTVPLPPLSAFRQFKLTVGNTPPTISNIPDQFIPVAGATGPLPFTVGDAETPANNLTVGSVTSTNVLLIPVGNVFLAGVGPNRTVNVVANGGLSGSSIIGITVTDGGGLTATETFKVTVNNGPPTITPIANQVIPVNGATPPIPFTIDDSEDLVSALTVVATSSNATLVPNAVANVTLAGSGANRTIQITPAAGLSGVTVIEVKVTDTGGLSATSIFTVTVGAVFNTPPTCTLIPNQAIAPNSATPVLPFTIGDDSTPVNSLVVAATSNNTTLVPNAAANIVLGGAGANRTIQIIPAIGQIGSATIDVTVTDTGAPALVQHCVFVIDVGNGVNAPPSIGPIPNQVGQENQVLGPILFQVADDATPVNALTVSVVASSNTTLIPLANIVLGGGGANRTVTITPAANEIGLSAITLKVTDGGGLETFTVFVVSITNVNDAPTQLTNLPLTVNRGSSGVITAAFLKYTDSDNTPAQLVFTVLSGPSHGQLWRNGVGPITSFTQAEIDGGIISYVNGGGPALSDSFTFKVSDGINTTAPAVFLINVTPVAQPPFLQVLNTLGVVEDGLATITDSYLKVNDLDSGPAQLVFTIVSGPSHGTLFKNNIALLVGGTFTQQDIDQNRVYYKHDGSESPNADQVVLTFTDGATPPVGPIAFNIAISAVGDAPFLVTNNHLDVLRGASGVINAALLQTGDTDTPADQLVYTILVPTVNGQIHLNDQQTTTFTQADVANNRVKYFHNGTQTTGDSFQFKVCDATACIGPYVFSINVVAVSNAPEIKNLTTVVLNTGQQIVITPANLTSVDGDSGPAALFYTVVGGPSHGQIRLNNVPSGVFTQDDIDKGRVAYKNNGDFSTVDAVFLTVQDQSGNVSPVFAMNFTIIPYGDVQVQLKATVLSTPLGSTYAYIGYIRNAGSTDVTVAVSDDLPSQLFPVTWTCSGTPGSTCNHPDGVGDIIEFVQIKAGGTITFVITVRVDSGPGPIFNTMTATPNPGHVDGNPGNNSSTDKVDIGALVPRVGHAPGSVAPATTPAPGRRADQGPGPASGPAPAPAPGRRS